MHTTQVSPARPCTTNHHASKRRAAVWSALLSVLILTAAVVIPAAAAPPGTTPGQIPLGDKCSALAREVYLAYIKAGASEATASAEGIRANDQCLEKTGQKPKRR